MVRLPVYTDDTGWGFQTKGFERALQIAILKESVSNYGNIGHVA